MKYKVNDIIINKSGKKRQILEVLTQTYIVSVLDKFEYADSDLFTETELDKRGYTLYQEPKPKIVWGDKNSMFKDYWYLDSCGYVSSSNWTNNSYDIFRLKTNNIFDTEEECEARLKEILES